MPNTNVKHRLKRYNYLQYSHKNTNSRESALYDMGGVISNIDLLFFIFATAKVQLFIDICKHFEEKNKKNISDIDFLCGILRNNAFF